VISGILQTAQGGFATRRTLSPGCKPVESDAGKLMGKGCKPVESDAGKLMGKYLLGINMEVSVPRKPPVFIKLGQFINGSRGRSSSIRPYHSGRFR